jgi:prevent-host-death family protein
MAVVGIRELSHNTSRVIKDFEKTGEPVIVTREGRPIGALMPVDQTQLQDIVLATAPELREAFARAGADIEAGRTRPIEDIAREYGVEVPEEAEEGEEQSFAELGEEASAEVEAESPAEAAPVSDRLLAYTVGHQLKPLAKALKPGVTRGILSRADRDIDVLSRKALRAIGEAEKRRPAESEARQVIELTATAYGQLLRRNLLEQLGSGNLEQAVRFSHLKARVTLLAVNRSLDRGGSFSFDQYAASLRGMSLAFNVDDGELKGEAEALPEEAPRAEDAL